MPNLIHSNQLLYPLSGSFSGSLQGTSSFATSASFAISASYAATSSYATVAANGGVTKILAGANVNISPVNGLGDVTVTSFGTNLYNTATGSYGSFFDTGSVLAASATAIYSMSLSTTDISNGVFISSSNGDNTKIKFTNAGVYNVQFSAQFSNANSSQAHDVVVWIRKNDIGSVNDIPDSSGICTVAAKKGGVNGQNIASWNYYINISANDFIQLCWHTDTANNITLETIAAGTNPTHPRTPSLILTAQRVDTFLSNTGSFSGSFTGNFTGSLFGTASFASTASFAPNYVLTSVTSSMLAPYVLTSQTSSMSVLSASFASTVPSTGIIGDITRIATGSVTASVTPTGFTVLSGSMTEFSVTGTGVTIGSAITDTHRVTGSLNITGSAAIVGSFNVGTALNVTASTNNVQIGTAVDAGFKLDVQGTTRINGATTITGSTTIAGNTLMNVTSATPTVTNGALRIIHNAAASGSGTGGVLALGGNAAQLNQNFAVITGRREDGTSDRGYFSIFVNGAGQSGPPFLERIRVNSDGATFFNQSKDNQVQVVPVTINATQGQTGNLLNFVSSSGTVYSAFDATGSLVLGNSGSAGYKLDVQGTTRTTGNTLLGTTLLSRIGVGTTTPTASLHVLGTISGSGPVAGQEVLRGVWLQPILHPSSSAGTVYGLDVNPTFDRVFPGDAIGSYAQYGARIFVSASMTSSSDIVGILTLEGTITDNNAGNNSINRFLSITPTLNKVLGSPAIATYNTNIYSAPTIQTGSGAGLLDGYWRDIVSAPTIRGVRNIQQVMCFSATPTVIPVFNQNGLWGYYYSGSGGTANNHTAYENVNGNNAFNTSAGSTFIGYPTLNNTTTFKLDVLGNTRLSGSLNVSSSITITGSLLMPTGSAARVGTATLVAGNTSVSNTTVTANSLIYLTTQTVGGTPGALYIGAKSAGTSFAVSSSNVADTSTFAYFIIN